MSSNDFCAVVLAKIGASMPMMSGIATRKPATFKNWCETPSRICRSSAQQQFPQRAGGSKPVRVNELDSVRGIAAFIVVLHHCWEAILPDQNTYPLLGRALAGPGWLGDAA